MSSADYCFLVAQVFIARSLNPWVSLGVGLLWLIFAMVR